MTQDPTSIVIEGVPSTLTIYELRRLCGNFGKVKDLLARVTLSKDFVQCHDFKVTFQNSQQSSLAIQGFNEIYLNGVLIRAKLHRPTSIANKIPLSTAAVYVCFFSEKINTIATEWMITKLFAPFGELIACCIKRSSYDQSKGSQNGYGFVHFRDDPMGIDQAFTAIASVDNTEKDGVRYKCEVSRQLYDFLTNPENNQKQNDWFKPTDQNFSTISHGIQVKLKIANDPRIGMNLQQMNYQTLPNSQNNAGRSFSSSTDSPLPSDQSSTVTSCSAKSISMKSYSIRQDSNDQSASLGLSVDHFFSSDVQQAQSPSYWNGLSSSIGIENSFIEPNRHASEQFHRHSGFRTNKQSESIEPNTSSVDWYLSSILLKKATTTPDTVQCSDFFFNNEPNRPKNEFNNFDNSNGLLHGDFMEDTIGFNMPMDGCGYR